MSVSSDQDWYLAQLKPGGMDRAVSNLRRQSIETFMPMRRVTNRRGGRLVPALKPLFPGYLFLCLPDRPDIWRSVNATYGLSRLVSLSGDKPTRVKPELIDELRAHTVDSVWSPKPQDFCIGQPVRILGGAFSGQIAQIEDIQENERIFVLLDIMGRSTRTQLKVAAIEAT